MKRGEIFQYPFSKYLKESYMSCMLTGPKLGGAGSRGILELSCGSLKFLQGSQKCTGFYTQHLLVAFEDAIGLSGIKTHFHALVDIMFFCYQAPNSLGGHSGWFNLHLSWAPGSDTKTFRDRRIRWCHLSIIPGTIHYTVSQLRWERHLWTRSLVYTSLESRLVILSPSTKWSGWTTDGMGLKVVTIAW